ncbi:hypothetical protein KM043_005949 [Ampulex compressa]|nr:hypothetical protein KM043_005949 [Ampulex compressa]
MVLVTLAVAPGHVHCGARPPPSAGSHPLAPALIPALLRRFHARNYIAYFPPKCDKAHSCFDAAHQPLHRLPVRVLDRERAVERAEGKKTGDGCAGEYRAKILYVERENTLERIARNIVDADTLRTSLKLVIRMSEK